MSNLPKPNHPCTSAIALEHVHHCWSEHQCTAPYVIGAGATGGPGANATPESQSKLHGCSTSNVLRQRTIFDDSVADRIEALLARCEGVRRGSDLHVVFDAEGEAAARAVARRDEASNRQCQSGVPLSD